MANLVFYKTSMKFAICNETFENWPQEEVFLCAAKLGYTGIEIAPFTLEKDIREITQKERFQLRHRAEKSGLNILGLHWLLAKTSGYHLSSPSSETRTRTIKYLKELIQLCSDLGGKIMVFGSPKQRGLLPGIRYEQGMEYAAEVFQAVMPFAHSRNVTIGIEPLSRKETNFINTAAQGMELIERTNHPNFQLHLDVKAMSDEGKALTQIIRDGSKHIVHYHANDPDGRGPGTSGLDHKPLASALKETGYQGWISVEVFDFSPSPLEIATQAIHYLKETYV